MSKTVTIELSEDDFDQISQAVVDYAFLGHVWDKDHGDWHEEQKAILLRLAEQAMRVELYDIAARLAYKWRDIDSPKGEYASSSSPMKAAA